MGKTNPFPRPPLVAALPHGEVFDGGRGIHQMKTGEQLRDEGMQLALFGKDQWVAEFMDTAARFLDLHGRVTSEDVIALVGPPPGSSNAIGGAMRKFATMNGLRPIAYERAGSPSRHAAIIAVWGKQI